jgi:hypothetical protein
VQSLWDCRTSPLSSTACSDCLAGKFVDVGSSELICSRCLEGQFTNASNLGNCTLCPEGYYQPTKEQTSCLPCIPGKFNDLPGQRNCTECDVNYVSSDPGAFICVLCDRGSGTDGVKGRSRCTGCSPGKAATGDGGTCVDCASGQFRATGMNNSRCSICPVGQTSVNGSVKCQDCDAGQYGDTTGKCHDCDPGSYRGNKDVGARCISCPAGYATHQSGQPFCLECDAGKFSGVAGAQNCSRCPDGQWQDTKRSDSCNSVCPDANKPEPNEQRTACAKPEWTTAADCGDTQILDNRPEEKTQWKCMLCPPGGACRGAQACTTRFSSFGSAPSSVDPPFGRGGSGTGGDEKGRGVYVRSLDAVLKLIANSRDWR